MSKILDEILSNKKTEIANSKVAMPLEKIVDTIVPGNGSFLHSIQKPGLNIIAEIKPKSPSAGILRAALNLDDILAIYNRYACALSVLTDHKFFGGGFDLLSLASKNSPLPLLCKDFILDPYQCYLARAHDAQAVLLIAKILKNEEIIQLYQTIKKLGMTPVLEIQNSQEYERIGSLTFTPEVILINNRNLEDFTISLDTTKTLVPHIAKQTTVISASGIECKHDIETLRPFCSNFLVGSLFMRSSDPEQEFRSLFDVTPILPSIMNSAMEVELT